MLHVNAISKRYGDIDALSAVTVAVARGEIVGLLGANGAGKTTLLKCIAGLVTPSHGEVLIEKDGQKRKAMAGDVSIVLEGNRNIYWRLTVKENVNYFLGLQGKSGRSSREMAGHILRRFSLDERTHMLAKDLSRGMQQKLAIVCALVQQSPVLLLDEPSLGLDLLSTEELIMLMCESASGKNQATIVSSHDCQLLERVCDYVYIVDSGSMKSRWCCEDSDVSLRRYYMQMCGEMLRCA